jgi:hypothetical protein
VKAQPSMNDNDLRKSLWLPETVARNGGEKILSSGEDKIIMVIPPKSYNGLVIRLKGLGSVKGFIWRDFKFHQERGNLLVKLCVYPDHIMPQYGSFDMLDTDDMFSEGWVYRKIDQVIDRMGKISFLVQPLQAEAIADLFNEHGWRAIFDALVNHMQIAHFQIEVVTSNSLQSPGNCQQSSYTGKDHLVKSKYKISIDEQFLDNPFSIAAILAHELCHVIYFEIIDGRTMPVQSSHNPNALATRNLEQDSALEAERMVDLLVFMFKLGEFQLRVSRDQRITFGYFSQDLFERIQVIVSRKLKPS